MDIRKINQIDKCHGEEQRDQELEGHIRIREVDVINAWNLACHGKINVIRRENIAQKRVIQKLDTCCKVCNDVTGQIAGCSLKIHVESRASFFGSCDMFSAEKAVQKIDSAGILQQLVDGLYSLFLRRKILSLKDPKDQRAEKGSARAGIYIVPLGNVCHDRTGKDLDICDEIGTVQRSQAVPAI